MFVMFTFCSDSDTHSERRPQAAANAPLPPLGVAVVRGRHPWTCPESAVVDRKGELSRKSIDRGGEHVGPNKPGPWPDVQGHAPEHGSGRAEVRQMDGRTLGELVRTKIVLLAVCRRCKHESVVYPFALIPRLGEHCLVGDVHERLRCSRCKARMVTLYEAAR